MAPKKRKTKNASRATASTFSQQSMSSESLLTTQVGSPMAASSPQRKPGQKRTQTTANAMIPKLTSTIQQAYFNSSTKAEDLFSTLMSHVSEDQMDMVYTSIYDNVEMVHPTFRENFMEAITGKQSKKKNKEAVKVVVNKKGRDFKENKSRRSRSEERNGEPKADIRRSRSRTHLEVPQTRYVGTSFLSENINSTYVVGKTQQSVRETPSIYGSSYKIAAVTPVLSRKGKPMIYRKPMLGEHVISMSGSPILVTTDRNQNEAEIHIQGKDGKVYAIAPGCLENVTDFPGVDPKHLESIKKIQQLLEKQSSN